MPLFKYFEKRAKDGLSNPNGLLSSRIPSDKSIGQPRVSGSSQRSAESAPSEGKKCGPSNR